MDFSQKRAAARRAGDPPRVLIALDDLTTLSAARDALPGCRIEEASGPSQLLAGARDRPPDLILLGGKPFTGILAELETCPATAAIPVLLLLPEADLRQDLPLPRMVQDIVTVPLRAGELSLRVARVLDKGAVAARPLPRSPDGPGAGADGSGSREEEDRLRRQNQVLVELAKSPTSRRGDLEGALREITEAAARTLEAERTSVWFFGSDREKIACADLYQRSAGEHSSGMVLARDAFPTYFRALDEERALVANEAREDPRTCEFRASYLEPLDITSMLDAPIRCRGRIAGVVCHEHVGPPRTWAAEEQAFAASLADLVAVALLDRDRREAEDALRESEARHRSLVEHIPAVTYITPALPLEHRVHSAQLERVLRFPSGKGKDDPHMWESHLHPEDRERVLAELERSRTERRPFRCEYRMTTCEGSLVWIRDEGNWVLDDRCGFSLQGVMVDITDRKAAEDALREADRRKDHFLAILAHELRNPLAPIHNSLELFKITPLVDPDLSWARDVLERQVRHLTRLVDDLLDVSRITLGKVKLQKEPLDVSEVVARAIDTSSPEIDGRRHRLEVSLPPEPLMVEGDEVRLAQVLSNLLNNAAKYMDERGRIRLSGQREGNWIVLRVRDEGMGISAEMLPRIFEPFMQVDSSLRRAQGGLGIGLTLVRSLVRLHGGTVQAMSEGSGRGSEFVVRLPALSSRKTPPQRLEEVAEMRPAGRRILVVDDNEDAARSLALLLKKMGGNEVQTAFDGRSALNSATAFRPDLVLLDIGLPEMDGYEVARRLRRLEAEAPATGRRLLIVALTGYGQEEDLRRARESGFDRHLLKPLYPEKLCELLESLPLPGGPCPPPPSREER